MLHLVAQNCILYTVRSESSVIFKPYPTDLGIGLHLKSKSALETLVYPILDVK